MVSAKNILIGTGIIGTVFFIVYSIKQRKNDNPKIFSLNNKLINKDYNGFTLPPFGIFIRDSKKDNKSIIVHELTHWKQYQREGLLPFLFNYSKQAIQKGWDKNPYEIEAKKEEEIFKKNNIPS